MGDTAHCRGVKGRANRAHLLTDVCARPEPVRDQLASAGARIAASCEIELEEHTSTVVFGAADGNPDSRVGVPAVEVLDAVDDAARRRGARARSASRPAPRVGKRDRRRVLPAEAGLDERAVSFTKGCYPGQEPVARLHHRGKVEPQRCACSSSTATSAGYDAEIRLEGKSVGRVTSAVPALALAYVRTRYPTAPSSRSAAAPRGYTDRSPRP